MSRTTAWLALATSLTTVAGPVPLSAAPASFQEISPGPRWQFERKSDIQVRMQIFVNGDLHYDTDETDPTHLRCGVETLPPARDRWPRWSVRDESPEAQKTDPETKPISYQVIEDDAGTLREWQPDRSPEEVPPGEALSYSEEEFLQVVGLGSRNMFRETFPEEITAPARGTILPSLADAWLSLGSCQTRSASWTLATREPGGIVVFDLEVSLDDERPATPPLNSIASTTVVILKGQLHMDWDRGLPLSLVLGGPVVVEGSGQHENLSVDVSGEGHCKVELRWLREPE